ncbi:MAG: proton-conducting transporter membrane subunit [Candidatus Omnitrophica bacterium]|nr:proton-conducting transporter membrane subunit [Candidatus Omnitrophota bacterium]
MPSLLILMPLIGIVILNLPLKDIMRKFAFWFALILFVSQILLAISHHPIFWRNEFSHIDSFFKADYSLDQLSFIMLLCIGIVSISTLLVARNTIHDEKERFKFINLLIIASIGMSGIVIVRDIFSLYVFLEVTAISTFVLIAFEKDIYALEGAFKYLILSAVATIMILTSIALLFMISGSTSFAAIREALLLPNNNIVLVTIGLLICGLLIKGGLVPFHAWVPDSYSSAPAAVSVLLGGIVTKVAGIYTLIRVLTAILGFSPALKSTLLLIGTLSILVGAFAAMGQNDMKRMLAYSSISQVGYIVVGFGTGTFLGIAGAIFHLFNHSIFKSLLFVNSAAVETRLGTTDMDKMGGLSSKMPITGATSVIGLLSAAGIPPLSGFWSKLMIIIALWQSGSHAYSVIAIMAGVITLAYLLVMQRRAFFGKLAKENEHLKEARPGIATASIILAAILVASGIFFPFVFNTFIAPLQELITK